MNEERRQLGSNTPGYPGRSWMRNPSRKNPGRMVPPLPSAALTVPFSDGKESPRAPARSRALDDRRYFSAPSSALSVLPTSSSVL